jgi:long-chain acyl-CoA synthetase
MKELIYHQLLLPAAEKYGGRSFLHDGDYEATFVHHADRVLRLAHAMSRNLGVAPGDRVALMGLNSHQFMEITGACMLGAGILNPLNLRLSPSEMQHILRDSGTTVAFVDAALSQPFTAAIAPVRDELPLRAVVLIGDAEVPFDFAYEDLLSAGEPRIPAEPEEDDPCALFYTGGTTGLPKGVLHSQRSEMLYLFHSSMAGGVCFRDEWIYLHQAPMFHATAMISVLSAPAWGVESVILPSFDPGRSMEAIERYGVHETVLVPTMIHMVLSHPEFRIERLKTLKRIGYGAAPMPKALMERMISMLPGLQFIQGFGMTEAGVLTILPDEDHHKRPELLGSVGRATPGVRLSIRDEGGSEVPAGQEGEVCAKGGNLMLEYWNQPEATKEAFRGGWYHTGDAGRLDEEGYLYLVDRIKDMIVSGGENVYSVEVENAISTHPAVAQVAVIGIPHDVWGEQVHAIVVLKPDAGATEEEITEHARQTVAGFKIPKSVEFRTDPLPLSAAMKVLKRELRKPYWEGRR